MKVLVIGNGSTGVDAVSKASYINNHTGVFVKAIAEVHEVTFSQFTTVYNRNSNLQNLDLEAHGINYYNLPNKKHPLFLFKLIKLIRSQQFIYIFYPGTLGTIVGLLASFLKVPYGLYVRGEYFNRNRLDQHVLNHSKILLTISPAFVPVLQSFCNNVAVIKPMISITEEDLKQDRNFKVSNPIKLLFVGRVEVAKGIYEILEIAAFLKSKKIEFILDIVGGGDLYDSISADLIEKELEDNVFLHGQIADASALKKKYDSAHIFVFPSHHEGFPRVLYEAMTSALPIFTTFVGGISGRMTHLENCIEIPVKNGAAAAEIVFKYITDFKILETIGNNGQNTIKHIIDGSVHTHETLLLNYLKNEK